MDHYPRPSCVKPLADFSSHPELAADPGSYDFWSPDSKGSPILDFGHGVELADYVLADAKARRRSDLSLRIIGGMSLKAHTGNLEMGFLWAIARKAIHGALPTTDEAPAHITPELQDECRKGIGLARHDLTAARLTGNPGEIVNHMEAGVKNGELYADFGAYCRTVVEAAMAAGEN